MVEVAVAIASNGPWPFIIQRFYRLADRSEKSGNHAIIEKI
jgi:hypothetical protein